MRQRRAWGRPATGANAKATRALHLIRKFKKEEEVKTISRVAQNNSLVAITPQYESLNLSTIGNTSTTRIGNKISAQSITIRGIARLADGETAGATVRLVLVWDRKPVGALPTWSNIFTGNQPFALYNIDPLYAGRFQVLSDETYDFTVDGQSHSSFKIFVPLKGKKVAYNGNLGTVADLQKGHIFLAMISSDNDQNLQVKWDSRFRFTDA